MSEKEEALVTCGTTAGGIVIKMHREWSPNGYDRAVALFERGFYDESHFFRVAKNFLVQFGISYSTDKELQHFARQKIPDDPKPNGDVAFRPGLISFAGNGDNSRTSQLFISYGSAPSLGKEKWETPVGEIIEGMEHARNFYSGYGDMPPWGNGPVQGKIHGNPNYIAIEFPKLDRFETCEVRRMTPEDKRAAAAAARTAEEVRDPESVVGAAAAAVGADEALTEEAKKKHNMLSVNARKRLTEGVGKLRSKTKTAYEENGNQMILIAFLAISMIVYVSVKNRRKIASKTS